LIVLGLVKTSSAQLSNLIVFSEGGERFSVILNGIMQNASPETNIKISDLNAPNYTVKILFEDRSFGELQKQIFLNQGFETTYAIKRDNKGAFVIRMRSQTPLDQAPPRTPQQTTIVYTTVAPVPAPTTVTYTQTTTTNQNVNSNPDNVNVGLNVGGVGLNFNVNVNDGNAYNDAQTTTTYSTTTTTTTSGGTGTTVYVAPTPQPQPVQVVYLPGYSGPVGCAVPMSQQAFASAKQSIASKTFEDSKLTLAKQIMNTNCLLSSQVKEIMLLFTFEDTRLQLAKYAYGYTYDIGNYYQLNDAFTFESSIDELNAYINASGR
jgi:hypothetical protein